MLGFSGPQAWPTATCQLSVWLEHLWVPGKESYWRKEVSVQPREE